MAKPTARQRRQFAKAHLLDVLAAYCDEFHDDTGATADALDVKPEDLVAAQTELADQLRRMATRTGPVSLDP